MKFVNLNPPYLEKDVAVPVAKFCQAKYGKSGFKIQTAIEAGLEWRPTFQLKTSPLETLAVEVSDVLFPAVLKTTHYDLQNGFSDHPVVVYAACPLAVYQADQRHAIVNQLRSQGFGLFTADDVGNVIEQIPGIPVIHHVSTSEFANTIKKLPTSIKVKLGKAYDVYKTRSYQGLQDAAQVVEALVFGFANSANKNGWIKSVKGDAADALDDLYNSTEKKLQSQRAAIGLARGFVRYHRNISSHPPKTRKKAAELTKSCRKGFLQALEVCNTLVPSIRACGVQIRLHIP